MTILKTACIQMTSGDDIAANIATASRLIRRAAGQGAMLITLPENVFLMPKNRKQLLESATLMDANPAVQAMIALAQELQVMLLIGSIALKLTPRAKKLVNRSILIAADGIILAHYDKIHLYDVTLANGEKYHESNKVEHGFWAVLAEPGLVKIGLTICYDVRFPHLYRGLAQAGAEVITVPAAFTEFTGQAHWHTLLRARAIENGCYIVAPAQTGLHPNKRRTYGHSLIIDPWGEILADGGEGEGVVLADIDTARVVEVRASLPSLQHDQKMNLKRSTRT